MTDAAAGSALEDARRELEELVYAISHDVRSPLRVIDGFSDALLEEYGDSLQPGAVEYLTTIRSATGRMEQLFDGVHQLSRVSQAPLRSELIDVTALADSIASELVAGEPSRDARFVIEPGIELLADAALLRMALTHLLHNAWKFSAHRPGATITVGRERDGSRTIFVRDDGVGLDLSTASRLFGPFQRFHPASEFAGLGIGLALVKRIAHRLGGRVRAESAPQQGMTVYMELP
jgi:light-regulated signal transduction histidine kinase (bacteriophytochrome)